MEAATILRTFGALALVIGMLAGALWLVRRFNIRVPGAAGGGQRLTVIERAVLDGRRSVALIRRDGREHLLLLAPEGALVIEQGIVLDQRDEAAAATRAEEAAERERLAREALQAASERLVRVARRGVSAGRAAVDRWRSRDFASMVHLPVTVPPQAPKRKTAGKRRTARR